MSLSANINTNPTIYAAGDDAKSQYIFFNQDSLSAISQTFQVNHSPFYIQAFSLADTDIVLVEQVTGDGSGVTYAPFCPVFGPVQLTPNRTKVRIDWPGRYRLSYSGSTGLGHFTTTGYEGSMFHESTMDMAEGLANLLQTLQVPSSLQTYVTGVAPIIVTGNGQLLTPYVVSIDTSAAQLAFVQGSSPIQVSGNGSSGNPYIVSVIPATNLEEENGSPANHVIEAGVLKHIVNATTALENCFLGVSAGSGHFGEVAIGYQAAQGTALAGNNVFIGHSSGFGSTASNSVFVGSGTGISVTASLAVAVGFNAGTGGFITDQLVGTTAVGYLALNGSIPGHDYSQTTCLGYEAGLHLASGTQRTTLVGQQCGANGATIGSASVGIGSLALSSANTIVGASTVAIGNFACVAHLGLACIGVGGSVFQASTVGDNSIALGTSAGTNSTIGANCTLLGSNTASNSATLGSGCFVAGNLAGDSATLDANAIVIGTNAAAEVNVVAPMLGRSAIAIGEMAFADTTTNDSSIAIGRNAGNAETHTNVVIIGADATALNATQNNQIILGNSTQTQLRTAGSVIQGGVIAPSDERLKTQVEAFTTGLDLVNKLRPVTFDWDETALTQAHLPHLKSDIGKRQYGCIAQELEKVLPNHVEVVSSGFGDFKFVRYDRLIPILLSAIKGLSTKVESLEKATADIEVLKQQVADLIATKSTPKKEAKLNG